MTYTKMNPVNYSWRPLNKPTQWEVYDSGRSIPKGSTGVDVAFGQSSKMRKDSTGKMVPQNVYRWRGDIYNA